MVMISHYAFIADILLTAALNKVGKGSPKYVPGDKCLGVLPFYREFIFIYFFTTDPGLAANADIYGLMLIVRVYFISFII